MAIALSDFNTDFGVTNTTPNIWYFNGTTYTRRADATTFDYFADNAAVGDCLYFLVDSGTGQCPAYKISINVGTALAATSISVVWEYSTLLARGELIASSAAHFKALTVTDTSNTFQNTGAQTISWQVPIDWSILEQTTMFGSQLRWRAIRCRITAVNTITEGGANSTTIASRKNNRITVTSPYISGTATSGNTYSVTDTSKAWTTNALVGRHIWFLTGINAGKCFPIRNNSATVIVFGVPNLWTQSNWYNYTTPETGIVAGDTYIISYNMEDILQADIAGGWNLVTDDPETRQFIKENGSYLYKVRCQIVFGGTSVATSVLFGGLNQVYFFYPGCGLQAGDYRYNKYAFGMRMPRFDSSNNPLGQSTNITVMGVRMLHGNPSFECILNSMSGWIYDTHIINQTSYAFVQGLQGTNLDLRNVRLPFMQISSNGGVTGRDVTQTGAEPLRNITGTSFLISEYKTGVSCYYQTANPSSTVLDSPAACSAVPWVTYTGFTSGDVTILDCDPDTSRKASWNTGYATTGRFCFKYRMKVTVLDNAGVGIGGAAISMTDKNNLVQFTDTTVATGKATNYATNYALMETSSCPATDGVNVITNFNPFILKVSKTGYRTHWHKLTITKAEDLIITLEPDTTDKILIEETKDCYVQVA